MEKEERILLPASVNPVSYEITLDPDFNGEKFEGFVRISCTVIETCLYLELHSKSIMVNDASIRFKGNSWGATDTIKSVFCPLGGEEEATFAVNLAAKGPQFFEDCFELLYPLPKPDLIGVLEFSTGAMEDRGAIILRTTNLLLNPKDSALDTMQRIAGTILHEISHMWFDDLVKMRHWDGLWLRECFVTLMPWYAADKMFPSWHFWDSYLIADPTDAKQIYDKISYQKGSCILRVVPNSLGDTKFFDGLKLYHRRYQFQCTESDDLWKAQEEVIGGSIEASMKVYTKYPGFPVLRVSESHDESGNLTGVGLFHHSFLTSGLQSSVDMNTRELILPSSDDLFKVKVDHGGFSRTSYSHDLLTRLLKEVSNGNLSLRDCVGLSCNLKVLVAGRMDKKSELLDLNVKFAKLDSFYVWGTIDRNLTSIHSVHKFHGPELSEGLRKLASDMIDPKAEELGWTISKDDDENFITFITPKFSGVGLAENPNIMSATKEPYWKRTAGHENAIPGSLWWKVFGIAAAHGGLEELEALVDL
ncbi:hypothetical protein BFJ72_g4738 [Fusarium proliferatum]|uniref:Uncharacterized protein n=1 Tax=Gibberella intermedia TaxID=948311 RepID=A0A420TP63_GIBIN|nr:hypothetical protein BFJ72_g4738 [Fusarium proliferatum]